MELCYTMYEYWKFLQRKLLLQFQDVQFPKFSVVLQFILSSYRRKKKQNKPTILHHFPSLFHSSYDTQSRVTHIRNLEYLLP